MTVSKRPRAGRTSKREADPAVLPSGVRVPRPPLGEKDEEKYKPLDWSVVRRLLEMLKPYRRGYAVGIALATGMILLEMQGPRFIEALLNTVEPYAAVALGVSEGADLPPREQAVRQVLIIIAIWAGVLVVAVFLQRGAILVMTRAGERVQFDLRRQLFTHLQSMSMSFFDRMKLGRLISRATSDINSMRETVVWGLNVVWLNAVQVVLAAVFMAYYTDIRLFLSVAWLGPVLLIVNGIYRKKASTLYQVHREGFTRVSTNLAENITGVRVVTAFNRQQPNLDAFNVLQVENTQNNIDVARANGIFQPVLVVIGYLGKTIILLYGGYLVVAGVEGSDGQRLGVGAVVAAFLYWDWFMNPIVNFGQFTAQVMQAMAGGERVFNLLDTKPEVLDAPDAYPLPAVRGRVAFEGVTFGYDPARPVLHGIDFDVPAGQTWALVGATGSGKSSIISLIARFYQPQQGRVLIDGHDLRHVTGDSLHAQVGLVLQANYLFTGTVIDNIRYVRPEASDADVYAAAKALGTHDAILALGDGYQTDVGERGAGMSLGQRQIICFTRAFLADPRIFMLDEATSAIDTGTEAILQRSLERLTADRTTFIVAHRLSTVMRADHILVIDAGRVIERGTHASLLAEGGRYAHLYRQFVHHGAGG